MRRTVVLFLVVVACFALPLFAQEKEMTKEAMPSMMPPKPLEDDFLKWTVGEWEGTTTSPEGLSQDWQKNEMALDGQFVLTHYTAKTPAFNYKGMGLMSINPITGEVFGYWFDSMRGVYNGKGKREGNKITAHWEGPMGMARDETMEKVSDDKFVIMFKQKMPDGNAMEGRTELTRKKMTTKM